MTARLRNVALVLAMTAAGCSDFFRPTEPSDTTPEVTFTGSVAAYGTSSHLVEMTRSGTLVATVNWTGNVDLDLYLTTSDCTGYPPDACDILVRSTASTGSSERVEWVGSAGHRFRVWVDNFSPTASADYTIVAAIR